MYDIIPESIDYPMEQNYQVNLSETENQTLEPVRKTANRKRVAEKCVHKYRKLIANKVTLRRVVESIFSETVMRLRIVCTAH